MKFHVRKGLEINYEHGMNLKGNFNYADMGNHGFPAEILELPYENKNFQMLLILPNEDTNIEELNLQDLDHGILESKLGKWKKHN